MTSPTSSPLGSPRVGGPTLEGLAGNLFRRLVVAANNCQTPDGVNPTNPAKVISGEERLRNCMVRADQARHKAGLGG